MTTKTMHFVPGRVYCVNVADATPLLVEYQGPEEPWEDVCSGEHTHLDADAIEDVIEVSPTIVTAIKLAHRKRPLPEQLPVNREERDDAPEGWECDVYWDD